MRTALRIVYYLYGVLLRTYEKRDGQRGHDYHIVHMYIHHNSILK